MALLKPLVQAIRIQADLDGFKKIGNAQSRMTKGLSRSMGGMATTMKAMLFGAGSGAFIKDTVSATMSLDSLARTFQAIRGSAKAGKEEMKWFITTSNELGTSIQSNANLYGRLLASVKSSGQGVSYARTVYRQIIGASRVMGMDTTSTQGAVLAIEQMLSKGKVSMEELQRQLGQALPGAKSIVARAMGVTTVELNEMIEAGMDSLTLVTAFSNQLKKEFAGDVENATKSIQSTMNRVTNAFFLLKAAVFGSAESSERLLVILNRIGVSLTSDNTINAMQQLGNVLLTIAENLDLVIIGLGFLAGFAIVSKIMAITAAIQAMGMAALVTRTIMFGWVSIIASLIALLGDLWARGKESYLGQFGGWLSKKYDAFQQTDYGKATTGALSGLSAINPLIPTLGTTGSSKQTNVGTVNVNLTTNATPASPTEIATQVTTGIKDFLVNAEGTQ